MSYILMFVFTFFFVLFFYEIFVIPKAKKNFEKKNYQKLPMEIQYVLKKYPFDLKKISFPQFLQLCTLISSLDIAIIVTVVCFINGLLLEIIVAFILSLILIVISFQYIYWFYKKKGMIKNV